MKRARNKQRKMMQKGQTRKGNEVSECCGEEQEAVASSKYHL